MKKLITSVLVAASLGMSANVSAANDIDGLLKEVKANSITENKANKAREAKFRAATNQQAKLLKDAQVALAKEEQRGEDLKARFASNEKRLVELENKLEIAKGDLGEMFGVVKGAAGNFASRLMSSNISAQYPGRDKFISELGARTELPRIEELERFWMTYLQEISESGKVVKFQGEVTGIDGNTETVEVARVGTFNLVADGKYVIFNKELNLIQQLSQQPEDFQVAPIADWQATEAGAAPMYIDPASGVLLSVFTQKASLQDRFEAGGTVGKIITALLILGLIIAIERFVTLGLVGAKIKKQRANIANPSSDNALGRIVNAYSENKGVDTETLELKLDEAILKETPAIEARISILKVMAAIAPMLGLLGTVTGMIATFQSIQLFGTGDPKLMAGGISMALVTTVLGLVAALPLMLLHAVISARSKQVVQILEEESAGIVAQHAEKRAA